MKVYASSGVALYCYFCRTAIVICSEWVREWVYDYYIAYTVVDVACVVVVVGAVAGVTIMILMVSGVFHRQLF